MSLVAQKPEKVQAYQLSTGALGNREQALEDMRRVTVEKWIDRNDLREEAIKLSVPAFIAKHGEALLHVLVETRKALD